MAIGYAAPEDVINAALRQAGYSKPISEIYEGSRASKAAVEVYGVARDALLASQDWDFAYREATLSASGGTAPGGFSHTYAYPTDCLRLRYVRTSIPSPNNDPQPVRALTYNDTSLSPAAKCIAANVTPAVACYNGQITDPATWNPSYTRAFVNVLAQIFAFALKDDINLARTRTGMAEQATMEGADVGDAMSPLIPELAARASRAAQQA